MNAPILRADHTSAGCFKIHSGPTKPDDDHVTGSMRPEMVEGSEPAQIHFEGTLTMHKRIDAETNDVRTVRSSASTHRDLLDKFQRIANAYYGG